MSEKKTLGDYRREAGMTQAELAERAEMSLSAVQKLERSRGKGTKGVDRMELRNARRMAIALGITLEELAAIED